MKEHNAMTILKLASALVIVFGVLVAMAAYPPAAAITRFLLDLIKWPLDGAQDISSPEMRLLSAISGGVMVGWGVLLWLVVTRLYPKDPKLAQMMIFTSIGTWFIIDSTASIIAGAPLNALFNTMFPLLFLVPIIRTRSLPASANEMR